MQKIICLNENQNLIPNVFDYRPEVPVEVQASQGGAYSSAYYSVFEETDFDAACYNFPSAFTLVGGVVGFDLTAAKVLAGNQAKTETATQQQTALAGYSSEAIAGQAALAVGSRIPAIQAVIVATNDLSDTLATNLAAIAAATDINEVNNIVNPPYGEISTSRTGNDFNDSAYITFNSVSLTEADTELFIPATSTVISYILPTQFNGFSEAFTTGNYLVQIREAATGRVLADFICPEGAAQAVSY